jgi:hypothetical protein
MNKDLRIFIFTHIKSSDNTNLKKDYVLTIHTEKTNAVQTLKKQFQKTLAQSKLNKEQKQTETTKFEENLKQGKFHYHFRDSKDEEEPQYFGKIHTRTITQEET